MKFTINDLNKVTDSITAHRLLSALKFKLGGSKVLRKIDIVRCGRNITTTKYVIEFDIDDVEYIIKTKRFYRDLSERFDEVIPELKKYLSNEPFNYKEYRDKDLRPEMTKYERQRAFVKKWNKEILHEPTI